MIKSYSVLNTVAATAGDITFAKGNLKIANTDNSRFPLTGIDFAGMSTSGIVASVAETAQVDTITFTAANSTEYTFVLSQNVDGVNVQRTYTYTSKVSGDTATTICDAFRAMVNASEQFRVTASGTTTLVLTADSGYAKFKTTNVTGASIVNATAGVYPKGQGADLLEEGIEDAISGRAYNSITFNYLEPANPSMGNVSRKTEAVHTLYVYNGDSDYTDFATELTAVLDQSDIADVTNYLEKI